MNPQLVLAIGYLIAQAVDSGISLMQILNEARAAGKISDETWEAILTDLDEAAAGWKAKRAGDGQ